VDVGLHLLPQIKRAPRRPESINLVLGGFLQQKIGFCKGAERFGVNNWRGNMDGPLAVAGPGACPYMGAIAGKRRPTSTSGAFQP
jgi:hypothetical protein